MAQLLYQSYGEGEIGSNSIANVAHQSTYAEGRFEGDDINFLNYIINDELPIPIDSVVAPPPSSAAVAPPSPCRFRSSVDEVEAPPAAHEIRQYWLHALLPSANPNSHLNVCVMPHFQLSSAAEVSVAPIMDAAAAKGVVIGSNGTPEMATAANSSCRSSYDGELYEYASPEDVSSFPRSPRDYGLFNPDTEDQHSDGEVKIIVETNTLSLHDGYTWRKYGEKRIKDQNYTRSYYRCAKKGCMIKKHTQKHTDNQVIFTYRGKHNHRC